MSEDAEMWRGWKEGQKRLRAEYGVPCPQCTVKQPRRTPTLLLPRQRCKVDGYVDPRPRVSNEDYERVTGWKQEMRNRITDGLSPHAPGRALTKAEGTLFNVFWYREKGINYTPTMIERHADINAVRSYCPGFDPEVQMLNGQTPGRIAGKDGQYYHIEEVER